MVSKNPRSGKTKTEDIELSVIIPVFNEEDIVAQIIEATRSALKTNPLTHEILVVDDGSTDNTANKAKSAGVRVLQHPYNIGNGAAIKTGIRNAKGAILVMLDGDGQHNPADIPVLVKNIGLYDMVVGSRTGKSYGAWHRKLANHFYNLMASYVSGLKVLDLTSGFRAIKANVARKFVYLLPNTFSYPTTITLSVIRSGHSVGYIPITANRRIGKSKIRIIHDGLLFSLIILRIATFFSPLKIFVPMSFFLFVLGVGYGLFRIFILGGPYGQTSALLITTSILVFLVGLISEQIAHLRFDRSEFFDNGS